MKKIIGYWIMMIISIIVLPFFIVRGCTVNEINKTTEENNQSMKVKVYMHSDDSIKEMDFDEYIKGVVAAEMPASFEFEALKAQAVAARTYALGRIDKTYSANDDKHKGADICTDSSHCQAWISKEKAMKNWSIFSAYSNWNKISKAVIATKDLVITYNGEIINPVFHANSGGITEDACEVWSGKEVPYLKSVVSEGEDEYKDFISTVEIAPKDFIIKLKQMYPEIQINQDNIADNIKILERTESDRVRFIKIGEQVLKGTDFRKVFSLRSSNFKIDKAKNGSLIITTRGYGHGVGMSQWGANYLAKKGAVFNEILKYYYSGVEIQALNSLSQ